jgi:glycosyltransferase involved in cell wall biosynthesis
MRLLIAGDGPLRAELEEMGRRCAPGRVEFLGFISDMKTFMRAADVLAFMTQPELGEGFGLAALEAMAAGRPVLATNVASLPEIVVDGRSGVVVPPGSVAAVSDALRALATDDRWRAQLGAGAADRARTAFTLEAMVSRTMAVYDECLT